MQKWRIQCGLITACSCKFRPISLSERWFNVIHANWWASWQPDNEIQTSIHASVCVWGCVCAVCHSERWRPVNCLIDLSTLHKGRLLCPPPSGCYSLPSPLSPIFLFHSPLTILLPRPLISLLHFFRSSLNIHFFVDDISELIWSLEMLHCCNFSVDLCAAF